MKNVPLLVGTIIASVLLVIGISVGLSGGASDEGGTEVLSEQVVAGDMRHVKGNPEASVTVVEFSDFQCPACKATLPLIEQLMEKQGENFKLVYRHMPLDSIHPNARHAAWATEAAASQGKFWEMHDKLFETQEEWSETASTDDLSDIFATYAAELELDVETFKTEMASSAIADLVQSDASAAVAAGVQGTPTFFVNGQKTAAPQLESAIESLVSGQ